MSKAWRVTPAYQFTAAGAAFADLDQVFALEGKLMASDLISRVIRVQLEDTRYFVKMYWGAGKKLRRYIGRTRIRGEWENLKYFQQAGVATAPIVAYGQEYDRGVFKRGALITEELKGTEDLANLAADDSPLLRDRAWVRSVADQVADFARRLHELGFVHTDMKWRNIMVTPEADPKVFFIDCPSGREIPGPLLARGVIKDLACLDKVAKYALTSTDRMYFYKRYAQVGKLAAADKDRIRRILKFFEGRE